VVQETGELREGGIFLEIKKVVLPETLKREIGLKEAVIYGVGVILGAGIYALLGEAAGIAGNALWLSFVFAAIIASFTALSYAELSSRFPKEAAEFEYVRRATYSRFLAFIVEYITFISLVISGAAVAFAFGGYFTGLFAANMPFIIILSAVAVVAVLTLLNFRGIKESAKFNNFSTIVEVGGLVLIIVLGLSFVGSVDYFEIPVETTNVSDFISPVFGATALIFFAYLGFQELANISEETRDASRSIPKAVMLSLAIATVLYILVSIVAVSVVDYTTLSESAEPLALIAEKAGGAPFKSLLSVLALFATSNTILVLLIAASRMLYGMSCGRAIPRIFSKIHRRTGTPYFSVLFVGLLAVAFILFVSDLGSLALLTNMGLFISFFAVNVSLILVRLSNPKDKPPFKVPFNIGNIPVTAVLGALSCLLLLPYMFVDVNIFGFEIPVFLLGLIVILTGLPVYYFCLNHSGR
jgi:APA family basic amino acid/polyamine antiporter